jgi:hypothetical protein
MATILANAALTWAEVVKRAGFDDDAAVIGDLAQMNDFIDECPMFPTTHGLYNKQLQAKRLGKGGFSKAYGPTTDISSQTDEITEPVKLYEGDSNVDDRVFKGVPQGGAYPLRDGEDSLNLEGMIQDLTYLIIYNHEGDTPDGWKGLWRRRPSLSPAGTVPPVCWGLGGTGSDLTSMPIFEFGRRGFSLAYPANSGVPGLKNEDRGLNKIPVPVGTGSYWAWIRHYEFWAAMVLRDNRAFQRLANIETQGASNIFDPTKFISAKNWLPSVGRNAVAFCTRTLKAQVDNNAYGKVNVYMSVREVQNYGPITFIAGVPVRMMEALLDTESAIA